MRHDLTALKEACTIPDVWERLGLPHAPGRHCRSPFRKDRSPSFSIYEGGRRWKDHGTGEGGDVIDFIAAACAVEKAEATRRFLVMAGAAPGNASVAWVREPVPSAPRRVLPDLPVLQLPPLHHATLAEVARVAASRHLDVGAVWLAAQSLRTVVFGEVCGHACWILTDAAGRIAEARRVDGLPFPATGTGMLGQRKAHTLRGSQKAWPVGVAVLEKQPHYRAVLLVEGGPDYLAALHYCITQDVWDVLPVAMLGRTAGSCLDPQALSLLQGRRIRIYPHADADGGGVSCARRWAAQLHLHGCKLDVFSFAGLVRPDGTLVKDLNDCALLDHANPRLKKLLP